MSDNLKLFLIVAGAVFLVNMLSNRGGISLQGGVTGGGSAGS